MVVPEIMGTASHPRKLLGGDPQQVDGERARSLDEPLGLLPGELVRVGFSRPRLAVVTGRQRVDAVTIPIGTQLRDAEMALIQATLESVDGDKETAAQILGIAARTIYRKVKEPPEGGAS